MNTLRLEEPTPREKPNSTAARPPRPKQACGTSGGAWRYVLVGITAIYVIVSLYFIIGTRNQLSSFKRVQQSFNEKLWVRQAATETEVKASTEALAQRLGITEQELHQSMQARATVLARQQQALDRRLQEQQQEQAAQKEQIGQVTGDVASVRSELGNAKTDIAATRTDLETAKVRLDRAIGDLTGQGSLIATTRGELEELKHRGDRNYYEFSLSKGARATAVSTVSLQLKKTNPKKNKFTLNVIADDRTIEKKNRGVAEPLQFYSGRDHSLYEIVIWSVEKNGVSGYLSTPKAIGTPVASR